MIGDKKSLSKFLKIHFVAVNTRKDLLVYIYSKEIGVVNHKKM